jgi:hypothetical protein
MTTALEKRVTAVSAKTTALIMLVEALLVDQLAKGEEDPAAFAEHFYDDVYEKEKKVRDRIGESAYDLQISEALTSLMDRAVKRAKLLRSKGRRPK